jgi:hypothetical protein
MHTPPSHWQRRSATYESCFHLGSATGMLRGHLTHHGHGRGLELLNWVLGTAILRRSHTLQLAIFATTSSWQAKNDHALLVEDVQVPPLYRLEMVIVGHRGPGSINLFRPQRYRFFPLKHESEGTCLKQRFHLILRPP